MSEFLRNPNTPQQFISRPYQKKAIRVAINFVKKWIGGIIERVDAPFYYTSFLLEMATGSGKTYTVGKILDQVINLRNRYDANKEFQSLNVVVLTNRIGGLNQFRDDLFVGRDGEKPKPPIVSGDNLENIDVYTFHSKADDLSEFGSNELDNDLDMYMDNIQEGIVPNRDNVFCSTFQTAILKDLVKKLPYIDAIIIDEVHNVRGGTEFNDLVHRISKKGRNERDALIVDVSATPSNITYDLFGEPGFKFGLAEYLASPYSPNVDYRLVTGSNCTAEDIVEINQMIDEAKKQKEPRKKKSIVNTIEAKFIEIIEKFPDMESLVSDLLFRIEEEGSFGETVIFANSIEEADEIAQEINKQLGISQEIALSYHSNNDNNEAVSKLGNNDHSCKIVIAIGKLNESIDIPKVRNVVFWNSTDVAKIFLQQFGRGLRGDGMVRYFDYVGGIKNFSWISAIYEEYKELYEVEESSGGGGGGPHEKFQIIGGNLEFGTEHTVNLSNLGFAVAELRQEVNSIETVTKTQLQALWKDGVIDSKYISQESTRRYAQNWNRENLEKTGFLIPSSVKGIIGVLGGDTSKASIEYIKSLLESVNYVEVTKATKEQLQELWKNGDIDKDFTSVGKIRKISREWNDKNSKEKGFRLPTTIEGLIGGLGGDRQVSLSQDYIVSLLNETEFIQVILATREQLQEIWKKGELDITYFTSKKFKKYTEEWNNNHSGIKGFYLPTNIEKFIGIFHKYEKSTPRSQDYLKSLLDGIDYIEIKLCTREQMREVWRNREIDSKYLSALKCKELATEWNDRNSGIQGFKLPTTITGIILVLGGDRNGPKSQKRMLELLEE